MAVWSERYAGTPLADEWSNLSTQRELMRADVLESEAERKKGQARLCLPAKKEHQTHFQHRLGFGFPRPQPESPEPTDQLGRTTENWA